MTQDSFTKGVFREMDGFLVLMSVLSTIQDRDADANTPTIQVTLEGAHQKSSCIRLLFLLLSEALSDEPENEEFFRVSLSCLCTTGFLTAQ
jgi:hypothetical protein